ncbi:MAG: HD domain-containing protein, partial [Clostridia bacterium]|nr:HD domain-containing protein [Clostridia bacterium]
TLVVGGHPVEVTTLRAEGPYADGRRPSAVRFHDDVEADLARRDFTINAMALSWPDGRWVDPWHGREDLRRGLIRTVGDPGRRFREDGLRLLRAVRLAAELGFRLEDATHLALACHADALERIAAERVGAELDRLLLADGAAAGLRVLFYAGLAAVVLPELALMVGHPQNPEWHAFPVLEHTLEVIRLVPRRRTTRWAALFHDAGKPFCRSVDARGVHFHGHDRAGAALFRAAAARLRLPGDLARRVEALVAHHMFPFEMGAKGMRRLLARLGPDGVDDLLALKLADLVGTGGRQVSPAVEAWETYRRRFREVTAATTALSTADLAVDGYDVMRVLGTPPGPVVGRALAALLEEVLEEPSRNRRDYLLGRLRQLAPQLTAP